MSINTYEHGKKISSVVNIKNQNANKDISCQDKNILAFRDFSNCQLTFKHNGKDISLLSCLDYCHKHKVIGRKCWRCQKQALHIAKTFLFLETKNGRYVNLENKKMSIRIVPDIQHNLMEDKNKTRLANKHIPLPRGKVQLADILDLDDINDIKDFILLHIVKKKK
jgi:hypothetical protein